jgi:two-component sensor histidine kinase
MTYRIIIIALVGLHHWACLAQYYPMPPPVGAWREPELLVQLKNAATAGDSVHIQLQLCNLYFNKPFKKKSDFDKVLYYAREASSLSTNMRDSAGFINAELFIGDVFAESLEFEAAKKILPLMNDSAKINLLLAISFRLIYQNINSMPADSEAICLAEEARALSINLHQPGKEVLALLNIACAHVDQYKPESEKELLGIIAKCRAIGFRNVHYIFNNLAILEMLLGKHDKALYYSVQAINSMRSTGDSLAAGDFYVVHAQICQQIDAFQECIDYSRLAMESYLRHSGEWKLDDAAMVLVFGFRKMKRLPEALETLTNIIKRYPPEDLTTEYHYELAIGELDIDMNKYSDAGPHLLRALNLGKQRNFDLAVIYRDLGRLYTEDHQYKKARPYLNKALAASKNLSFLGYTHYLLYLVDSGTGYYLAAMQHLRKHQGLTDSSLAESKQREIQKLLIQFETKEKENKIRIKDQDIALLSQKAISQKEQLTRSNLIKNITIGGIFLLAIIALLSYRAYRIKQRNQHIVLEKNEVLHRLVIEKEWLLKEVHHRVKNNLHTVNCLLDAQACYLENDALKAIQKSQQRIYAMSMIHQKIYQSEDISTINMATYLPEFIGYLRESFGAPVNVQFQLEVEALELGVSHAVPVALIINEAVNNSIKYAFTENKGGQIKIALRRSGRQVKLSVADNGIGIQSKFMDGDGDSLGMQLMKGLSREIKGEFTIETGNGTRITILFNPAALDDFHRINIPLTETASIV